VWEVLECGKTIRVWHDYEFNAVEYRGCVDIIVHKNNNIWKYPLHPKPIHKKPSPRVSRSVIDDEGRLYPEVVVGAVRSDPDNLSLKVNVCFIIMRVVRRLLLAECSKRRPGSCRG
jgi:hypothetical protein